MNKAPDLVEDEVDEFSLAGAARSIEELVVVAVVVGAVVLLKHFEEIVVHLALVVGEAIW